MKQVIMFCLSLCLITIDSSAGSLPDESDSLQTSPEFEFVTLTGQQVSSRSLKGKVIVLDFWNSTCNPCKKSMPQIEQFYQKFKNDERVAIFLVNSGWETIEKAKSFADSKRSNFLFFSTGTKYDLPFAYDDGSQTMKKFKLNSNPSTIIIDHRFRIRIKHSAYIEKYYEFLTDHIERYLAEK